MLDKSFQFDSSVCHRESPIYLDLSGLASVAPGSNLSTQCCLIGNRAIEALTGKDSQLNLRHIKPAAMLWRIVNIETVKQTMRFVRFEDLI